MTTFRGDRVRRGSASRAFLFCLTILCAPLTTHARESEAPATEESVAAPTGRLSDAEDQEAPTMEGVPNSNDAGHSEAAPEAVAAILPRDLSVRGMFMGADWVVKAVMIGLAVASMLTWTVLLAKSVELAGVKRRLKPALQTLTRARALDDAKTEDGIGSALIDAARAELTLSSDAPHKEGIKERVASSLSRIEADFARRLTTGTGLLATIGATAPFVGLFGTVWGIMNSFIGISKANTTNLAVVAPGIAEALLATALGLVAAIPAVVIYNHFVRRIATFRAFVSDMAATVLRLVSRDLDRHNAQAAMQRDAE